MANLFSTRKCKENQNSWKGRKKYKWRRIYTEHRKLSVFWEHGATATSSNNEKNY